MRKILLAILLLLSSYLYSATFYTTQNGSWTNSLTWLNGIEPPNTNSDTVYINHNINIPIGHEIIYGYIIINDTLTTSNNLIVATGAKFLIHGYMYSSNNIWNFGHIILDYGNICWKKTAPPGFYHGNPIEGWGYICGQGFGPLAVMLTKFEVSLENSIVRISWTTENEENNDHFIIEKSKDLKKWNVVANIKGSLHSSGVLNYKIYDVPSRGISYYRLSQIDVDNTLTVYNEMIRYIFMEYKYTIIDNIITTNDFYDIKIYDITGRLIFSEKNNKVNMNIYKKGFYIILLDNIMFKYYK